MRKRSERSEQAESGKIHRRILPSVSAVYWGIGTVFTVVLLIFGALGLQWSQEYRDRHSAEQKEAATQPVEQPTSYRCAVTIMDSGFACRAVSEPGTSERDKAEQYDLRAQQEMAEWAFAMMLIAAASVWIGVAGVAVVGWTLHETRQMTLATREIGESQSKAYVNVARVVIGAAKYKEKLLHFEARLLVTNTGETPAKRVTIATHCKVYAEKFSALQEDWEEVDILCDEDLYSKDVVDLPTDKSGVPVTFVLPKAIDDALMGKATNALLTRYIIISGKIEYSTVFKRRYLTEFVFKGYLPFEGIPNMQRDSVRVATYKEIGKDEED